MPSSPTSSSAPVSREQISSIARSMASPEPPFRRAPSPNSRASRSCCINTAMASRMVRHKKRPHGLKLRSLYLWHRYFGLSAALYKQNQTTTNQKHKQTKHLKLDQRHVQTDWLLDWYG